MDGAATGSDPFDNEGLFTNHYLRERVADLGGWACDDAARAARAEIRTLWERERGVVSEASEEELLDNWIRPVLETLGFGTMAEVTLPNGGGQTDLLAFESADARRAAATASADHGRRAAFDRALAVVEAKPWDAGFDGALHGRRRYTNAREQLKYYLDYTPEATAWGVVTDGRRFQLHWAGADSADTYYEVTLPSLLSADLRAFKYFFTFFRAAAFQPTDGRSFLDAVRVESERAARRLGADLHEDAFAAVRIVAEGLLERRDTEIGPADDERLTQLKRESLVVLYRLMFVFYAEARGLLPPDDPESRRRYRESVGAERVRTEVYDRAREGRLDEYPRETVELWNRFYSLFGVIDEGSDELDVPAYDGGLFERDREFLGPRALADAHLARVIYRLGTTETASGETVLADYADLSTRHLGSIYEGLLEHRFEIASEPLVAVADDGGQTWHPAADWDGPETAVERRVDDGDLYVVVDDHERKATGAYYTPDHVVRYVVRETVGPSVDEIETALAADDAPDPGTSDYFEAFYERVCDLRILDPAMGSGHFLTATMRHLTDRVMRVARETEAEVESRTVRRRLAKECLFGVDVNEMAVELAKLSTWLETLAADQPLAFLDHRLVVGNSLAGTDVSDVLSEGPDDERQSSLSEFGEVRSRVLARIYALMAELVAIDNESLADVTAMKRRHEEITSDPLYRRLNELADVAAAAEFGVNVPPGAIRRMARAITDEAAWQTEIASQEWFTAAQRVAERESFLHWELAFPLVFFDADGEATGGFDAVVGNPPYGEIPADRAAAFDPDTTNNVYAQFVARAQELLRDGGRLSFVTPTSWETGPEYEQTRANLVESGHLTTLVNLPYDVFDDAYVDTAVFVWADTPGEECAVVDLSGTRVDPAVALTEAEPTTFAVADWRELGAVVTDETFLSLYDRVGGDRTLGDVTASARGVLVTDKALASPDADEPISLDSYRRYERVGPTDEADWELLAERPPRRFFEGARLLVRRLTSRDDRLMATVATEPFVSKKDVYVFESPRLDERFLLGLVNSRFLSWWLFNVEMSASQDDFRQVTLGAVRDLPLPEIRDGGERTDETTDDAVDETLLRTFVDDGDREAAVREHCSPPSGVAPPRVRDAVVTLTELIEERRARRKRLNTDLADYLGGYDGSQSLGDLGLLQPGEAVAATPVTATTESYDALRITDATVRRVTADTVAVDLQLKYKPPDAGRGEYETVDPVETVVVTGLDTDEVRLVEALVPYVVDNPAVADGYRNVATTRITPYDRLTEYLRLPTVTGVRTAVEQHEEVRERANDLDEQIRRAERLLDDLVYELYGLSDDEIELVERDGGNLPTVE